MTASLRSDEKVKAEKLGVERFILVTFVMRVGFRMKTRVR